MLNYLNSRTSFKLTIVLLSVKLRSSSFHESNTPYYFLPPKLKFRPVVLCKCFLISLLFLCEDIQPNPGPMSVSSQNCTSPLNVYEPFSSPSLPNLRIATLNARSVYNKFAVIFDHMLFNKLDIICLTETWINDGEFPIHLPHPYFLQIIHFLNIMEGLVLCMMVTLPSSVINLFIIHPFQSPL